VSQDMRVLLGALLNVLALVALAQLGVWLLDIDRMTALMGALVGEYAWRWARLDAAVLAAGKAEEC
jgi:hypothetical protein